MEKPIGTDRRPLYLLSYLDGDPEDENQFRYLARISECGNWIHVYEHQTYICSMPVMTVEFMKDRLSNITK